MKTIENKNIKTLYFESAPDMVEYINSTPLNWLYASDGDSARREGASAKEFCGTSTYEESENLLINGDIETASKIKATPLNIKPSNNQKTKLSYVGFAPNVPAYLSGNPLNMYRRAPAPSKPIITICVSLSVNAYITSEEYIKAGHAILETVACIRGRG